MCRLTEKSIKNIKFDNPFRKDKRITTKVHQTVNCEIEVEFVKQNCECYWFDKRKMWSKPNTNPKIWGKRTQTRTNQEVMNTESIFTTRTKRSNRSKTYRRRQNQIDRKSKTIETKNEIKEQNWNWIANSKSNAMKNWIAIANPIDQEYKQELRITHEIMNRTRNWSNKSITWTDFEYKTKMKRKKTESQCWDYNRIKKKVEEIDENDRGRKENEEKRNKRKKVKERKFYFLEKMQRKISFKVDTKIALIPC